MPERRYARVAVEVEPYHLDRAFDYAVPDDDELTVGQRVEVVFAGRKVRGLVVELSDEPAVAASRVRPVRRALGDHVWVRPDELEVLRWAATRFGAPLADVLRHALPARTVAEERRAAEAGWFPHAAVDRTPAATPPPPAGWAAYGDDGSGLHAACLDGATAAYWRPLPGEDVGARLAELVGACLAGGRDALVVVPDPESPVASAIASGLGDRDDVVDVRGGPSPRLTYRAWLRARAGQARVVIGERGAAFWPLERLGLALVVDEASPALKERRSPRHHAREVVLERARRAGGVGLLVGTVPSAAAWRLLAERRLRPVVPPRERERSAAPLVTVETQQRAVRTRIAASAVRALRAAVDDGTYGVVLAALRGEGRALVCSRCGTRLTCPTCGSSVARLGGRDPRVHCAGCGWHSRTRARCLACGEQRFAPLAAGAERVGAELARTVDAPVAVLEGYAQTAPAPPAVLVLTRGSVLSAPPGPVGAVVLPDLDGQLRRPMIDAAEDALRLSMQLAHWVVATPAATRTGRRRADAPVIVQTQDPDHHAVRALVSWDPGGFWRAEAGLRRPLRFPPAASAVRVGLVADDPAVATDVDAGLRTAVPSGDEVLGPLPAERDTVTWLVKADDRVVTLAALDAPRRAWSTAGLDVRVDVDPVEVT